MSGYSAGHTGGARPWEKLSVSAWVPVTPVLRIKTEVGEGGERKGRREKERTPGAVCLTKGVSWL